MHRLFVALDLPAPVTDEIAAICHGLNGMRWVSPDNLHLTLRFIGEVPPSVTLEVEEALAEIDAAAFSFALVGIGHFESAGRPRAVWLGVEADPEKRRAATRARAGPEKSRAEARARAGPDKSRAEARARARGWCGGRGSKGGAGHDKRSWGSFLSEGAHTFLPDRSGKQSLSMPRLAWQSRLQRLRLAQPKLDSGS